VDKPLKDYHEFFPAKKYLAVFNIAYNIQKNLTKSVYMNVRNQAICSPTSFGWFLSGEGKWHHCPQLTTCTMELRTLFDKDTASLTFFFSSSHKTEPTISKRSFQSYVASFQILCAGANPGFSKIPAF
jgi:hypothetical protein